MSGVDDFTSIRHELEERKRALSGQLAALIAPPESGTAIGFGKRVGDGTTEAVERFSLTLTARSIDASIKEIDGALQRIEEGTYGICKSCGSPIPPERLEARPSTVTCVACAGKHDSTDSV